MTKKRLCGTTKEAAEKVIFAAGKSSGAKALPYFQRLTARLKSCPDTKPSAKRLFSKL
jgi:hypothetical protein